MKYYLNLILVLLACWSMTSTALSQETLEEKRARADDLFKDKNWSQAEGLYASVISNSPKNHDLNFRYGACLLYGSKNREEAIKRLRYSLTGADIDKRAYYFLGQAYHMNYQFNDALKQYKRFKELASSGDLKEYDVDTDIKACNFGKKLLANVTDMVVMQKTELRAESFYDLYKLDDIGGTLLITDIFQSKLDKKSDHRPIIHFPSNSPYIYYSSYGDDGATGLDIYVIKKLPGGDWSLAQKVKGRVNTELDEDFAYMHPNGQYLYFCSKGHNSMGGYDVFRSRYNPNDQSFGPPENLDFAISSPDDDLLFVVDSLDRMAYFSSRRESGQGNMTVYKVRVDRIPMQMAVIKGNYLNTINGDQKEVEVEVEDFSSGRIIGKFNSKKTNGDYLITFPKSGKYRYIITPKGSDVSHIYIVNIPYSKDFRPLKQSMTLKLDEAGEEFIEVTDRFDEEFDDPVAVMAEVYRELSKLPPNAGDFDLDSLDAVKDSDKIFVDAGLDPFITNDGLEAVMVDEVEDLTTFKAEEEKQRNIAYNLAQEKSDQANEKMLELNDLISQAEQVSDPNEKARIFTNAIEKKKEVEELNNEAQSLIELAETIDESVDEKGEEIKKAQALLEQAKALPDGDRTALIELVQSNRNYLVENVRDEVTKESVVTEALKNGANEQKRVQQLSEEISNLTKAKRALEKKNQNLEKLKANEKKQKIKDQIQRQMDENESEISILDTSIKVKTKELDDALNNNESVRGGMAAAIVLKDDYANSEYENELSDTEKQKIVNNVKTNDLTESLALVDKILEDNNVSLFNIDLYANDETTSSYSLEQWNEEIDKEKQRLLQEKLLASEERKKQIQEEIDRLERLRKEKESQYEIVTDDPASISPDVSVDDILPEYSRRKEQIETIVSEADRRKATRDLNYQLLREIQKERKRLERILENNPKAKNIKTRMENLERIRGEKQNEINRDKEWLAASESNNLYSNEQVINDLDPGYQRKVNEAYEIIDENERNEAIAGLNEILLERSNERIQELQAVADSDPDNQKAKEELEYLEDFVKELSENKSEPIVEPETIKVEELTADVDINDLVRNYDGRMKIIEGIKDEYKRRTEENKLYNEVVNKARNEMEQLDRLAKGNPDNKIIGKRQDALKDIDRDYNKSISKNKDWLAKNKPESIGYANEGAVRKANILYQTEADRIGNIENEGERLQAIRDLNDETLQNTENRLSELEREIQDNPSGTALQKEKEELEALRDRLTENMDDLLLAPASAESIVASPVASDIVLGYDERLDEINRSEKDKIEKEKDKVELNQELIGAIDQEVSRITDLLAQDPPFSNELEQRRANLLSLQAEKEREVAASKEIIGAEDVVTESGRPEISVEALVPDYESGLQAIQSSGKPEKEKLEDENELHQELVAAIDAKVAELKNEITANPDQAAAINKQIERLNQMRSGKLAAIDTNKARLESGDVSTDIATENTSLPTITVGDLMPDYESDLAAIKSSGKPEKEKLEDENELHQELVAAIDAKVAELKNEITANPDQEAAINKQIERLNQMRSGKLAAIDTNKARLESGDVSTDIATENTSLPEIGMGDLLPDYENELGAIQSSGKPEKEKLEDENELHQELVAAIDAKVAELKNEITANPDQEAAINKQIERLNQMRSGKLAAIDTNKARLESGDVSTDIATENTSLPEIGMGDLLPDYESELGAIQSSGKPEKEKLEDENELHQELVAAIDAKVAELKNEITANPDQAAAINKQIEKLNQMRSGKLAAIDTNKARLESGDVSTDIATENTSLPTITVGDLMPDYESELGAIQSSGKPEKEKLEDENELHQELVAAIDAKVAELKNEITVNPDQAAAINKQIERLNQMRSGKLAAIDTNKARLESGDVSTDIATENTSLPTITVGDLMPDYESDLAAIKSSGKSEKDKLEEENALHQMLMAAIDYKVSALKDEISANPADEAAINKQIEELNQVKSDKQAKIDTNTARLESGDVSTDVVAETRAIISAGELMSDYESKLADIRNGSGTDAEKLKKENELHSALIDLADERLEDLEQEKIRNPDQIAAINKDIDKLENIRRSAQNSVNINNDQLAQLGANELNRPSITIGSLVPDFEAQMIEINNSTASASEKLTQKNQLNQDLIEAINAKIAEVQEEWEEDPNNGFTYNQEMDKLEELKESKYSEIARNNDAIKVFEASSAQVAEISTSDYETEEGKQALTAFEAKISEIKELDSEIDNLNDQLIVAETEKERNKIQKSIDKAEVNKAELENEVIEGLEDINEEEIKTAEAALQEDKTLTANSSTAAKNGFKEDLQTANENLIIAEQKLKEAQELRNEAENEKDPLAANEKLKRAFELEKESKELIAESQRIFKMARAVNDYSSDEDVVVNVPENVADRRSTQLIDEAAALRIEANNYYDRATALRDSGETVKEKYQDAIVAEADLTEAKADQLNLASNDLESRAEDIREQEDVLLAAGIDEVNKAVDVATAKDVATSGPYKSYYAEKNKGDKKLKEANAIENQISQLKNKRARRFKMAVSGTDDDPEDVLEQDTEIAKMQTKIDSLTAVQKRLRDEALQNYQNAKNILNGQSDAVQENMMALEQRNVEPFERKSAVNVDFEVPDNIETNIFRTTDGAVYSDDSPIPVNQKQTTGLVYKVQVGAFRNPLPQDHFKEFAPISGERLNNGITRYMVGYFTKFDPANQAKGKVNDIGYGDAFVVAYCNGERITIDRARQIEAGVITCDGTDTQDPNDDLTIDETPNNNPGNDNTNNNTTADNATTNNTTNNDNTTTNNTTNNDNASDNSTNTTGQTLEDQSITLNFEPATREERLLTDYYTSVPGAAKANQVELIEGLFYTVQIGVYSSPVPNSALFNIQPLNSQRTAGGYIRYSTGIFKSEEAATIRRDEVVEIGVTDAFVTAYFKGERITTEEALQLLIRNGAEILVGSESNNEATNTNDAVETYENEPFYKEGLHYRILIGKYEDAIPGEYATLLLQGDDIFETEVDQDGRTCLVSSKIETYDEMIERLREFADLGIEDMEVVTYYKYDVIPFKEGEKIRKDQPIEQLHPYDEMQGISANEFVYKKEVVYFKVKLGEFEDKIPVDFTNLLLLYEEEENINKEETINDEAVFMTGSIDTYQEARTTRQRLLEKGFDRAVIVAYHKYDEISIEKAREILED